MTSDVEITVTEEDAAKLHLKLEELIGATSQATAVEAVDRMLKSRGMKAEIFEPSVYERFHNVDPEIAKELMNTELYSKKEDRTLEIETRTRDIEMKERILEASLQVDQARKMLLTDIKVMSAAFGIPLLLFVILVLFGKVIPAMFMLVICYAVVMSLFFVNPKGIDSIISKVKLPFG